MSDLVVFYSPGGNTRTVAYTIGGTLRADLMELHTVKEYPDDYDVLVSLGKKEVDSGYMPQLQPMKIDFTKYDNIYIGTPVWWYSYAPAVRSFLALYAKELAGKNVYPFATHGGWPGHTASDFKRALKKTAKTCPLLTVKFEEKRQITPNIAISEWLGVIAGRKD